MTLGARFWKQPATGYRNAQLLFAVLAVGFAVASFLYAALPTMIVGQFAQMDVLLGGASAGYPEPQCRIWTSLAAANVATLSVMSFFLLRDLRRNRAMHLPLLFMKTTSALLFLAWFIAFPQARSLVVAFAGDLVTGLAIWWLPRQAFADLERRPADQLVSMLAAAPSAPSAGPSTA